MSHYKANVRDLAFNLFEVLGLEKALASGQFGGLDGRRRPQHAGRGRPPGRGSAGRVVRRERPQPADLRPGDALGDAARGVQGIGADVAARRVDAHRPGRGHRRRSRARDGPVGDQRVPRRRSARGVLLPRRPADDGRPLQRRQRAAEALGRTGRRAQLGCHHGAHRARRGLRRRRRAHQGRRAARRHLAPRRRQAVHHLRRLRRPVREHRPPGAGATRRRGAGHQGAQPVPGAEVPARSRDGGAGRAQRRLRHRSRAQDGSGGVGDVRADVRSARQARGRLPGRRHPRGHRADVQDHGVRANGGGRQGDCHAVDRLSQRARVREDARPGQPT